MGNKKAGWRELEGGTIKGHEETFEGNGYVLYLEWMISYVKTSHCTSKKCAAYGISIIPH